MEKSSAAAPASRRTVFAWLGGLLRTMRIKQWTKNGFIFIPILFDGKIAQLESLVRVIVAFALFCLLSSAVYVLNDLVDVERDRQHPKKRFRPIASGQLPIPIAVAAAIVLPVISIGAALIFSVPLGLVMIAYYAKDLAYSFYLKNVVLIDVLALASGFILRVIAGVVVITVTNFSPWLYVCMGMLALFLAVGKRRQEMLMMAENATAVRAAFKDYNMALLDDMLRMVMISLIMSYVLYTVEARTSMGGYYMLLTVPFAMYGIFRYLFLIHVRGEGSAPDEVLFKDRPLLVTVILFVLSTGAIIYLLPKMLN